MLLSSSLINSLDKSNILFLFGSSGQCYQELHGKMSSLSLLMSQMLEQIMLNQVTENFHYSNMLITNNTSVHTLIQMLMMHTNRFTLNVLLQYLIKLLGFMHIMLIVEQQEVFTVSTRPEQLNVRRNWLLNTEFQDTWVFIWVRMEYTLHTMENISKFI